jgi:pimeloyl-ACP methyl ester carboxylesterase
VLLEAGVGDASAVWNRVQPEAAKFTRVCAYDRAGLGESEPASAPRTIEAVSEDLHALLTNAKISAPYVLVGHSLGGIITRLYASRHPKEVVGMVLIESAHEDEPARGLALLPLEIIKQLKPEDFVIRNPRESIDHCSLRAIMNAANWRAGIPLVVLTQGQSYNPDDYPTPSLAAKFYRLHLELQKDLVRRSPRGRQIIAKKSGHNIHQDQPELVIDAIRQVSAEVLRTARMSRRQTGSSGRIRPGKHLTGGALN